MSKMRIRVHEELVPVSSNIPENALTKVLVGLFKPGFEKVLADKGFPNPTEQEKALWVAIGLYYDLGHLDEEYVIYYGYELQRALNNFIENNGGWDYFPETK